MNPLLLIFVFLISVTFALTEIQIEGPEGWAKNLPTWKVKNPIKKIIGWTTLDGYHTWMWVFFIIAFHSPYYFGLPFSLSKEVLLLESFFLFMFVEDFLWFVFNPAWGIKKFFTKEIPWHPNKILYLPQDYWISFFLLIVLDLIRRVI
jgi:hypothetical protein